MSSSQPELFSHCCSSLDRSRGCPDPDRSRELRYKHRAGTGSDFTTEPPISEAARGGQQHHGPGTEIRTSTAGEPSTGRGQHRPSSRRHLGPPPPRPAPFPGIGIGIGTAPGIGRAGPGRQRRRYGRPGAGTAPPQRSLLGNSVPPLGAIPALNRLPLPGEGPELKRERER